MIRSASPKKISEKDIAAAVVKHLESQGLKVRQEVPVVLPDSGLISADIIACKTDETGEWFTVVECKRQFNQELIAQSMRWLGLANQIITVHATAKRWSFVQQNRAGLLASRGIGRQIVDDVTGLRVVDSCVFDGNADTRLISAAFHSSSGAHDPEAGSAGVKRQTDARSKYEPATAAILDAGMPLKWTEIQHDCPSLQSTTSHQAVKAIKNGDWQNAEVLKHYGPLLFRITEKPKMTALANRQMEILDAADRSIAPHNDSGSLMRIIDRAALDPTFDVAKLQALLNVKKEWEADEARKAFVAAMAAFKAEAPTIIKNKHVKFGTTEYDHATLDNVCAVVVPAMSKHGISHRWDTSQPETGGVRVTCVLTHILGHSERTVLQSPADKSGSKNDIQAIASAVQYLQRYTLLAATGLAVRGMDNDGRGSGDAGLINDAQKSELHATLTEFKRDVDAFLRWAGADELSLVSVSKFKEFMQSVRLMQNTAKKKAEAAKPEATKQ